MGQRSVTWFFAILLLVAAAVWVDLPDNPGLRLGALEWQPRVVRGLDLQGGLQVLLEADLPPEAQVTTEQMQIARDIIEQRINALGVTEPLIQVAGSRRIVVELPGVSDTEQAVQTIRETGLLEFVQMGRLSQSELLALQGAVIQTDYASGSAAPGTEPEGQRGPEPAEGPIVYHTVMTGAVLENATVSVDKVGRYTVDFRLTEEGARIFEEFTAAHTSEFLAIVLDKRVISIPRVESRISGRDAQITGSFTLDEANRLAVQLRYGALPVPLKVVESKAVGPTLGQDSLRRSATAGLLGLSVVIAFMVLYYRLPGAVAALALLAYAALTFAVFKIIPVTLTLPGIAGFVLSIGVAVDANILIFERMREELRGGRTLRQAIDLGFSRAWPSIRDSNLSTLLTCAILFWFGSAFGASIVKGFAFTLAVGVLVSLFTAITATRTFLHVALDRLSLPEHPAWFGI